MRGPTEKELEGYTSPVYVYRAWCKGCGICVEFCPKNVLEIDDQNKCAVVRPQDCIKCKLCQLRCPDFAIIVDDGK